MSTRSKRSNVGRALSSALVFLSAAFVPAVQADDIHYPIDRPLDVKHIRLDLDVDLESQQVEATATLDMIALQEVTSIRLDAVAFTVKAVSGHLQGEDWSPWRFLYDGKRLEILTPRLLELGVPLALRVDYVVTKPESGLHFHKPTEESPDTPYQLWTQGETTDNRYWVPCFDHPNEMQTTEMTVTVGEGMEVLSNGRLLSKTPAVGESGKTTFHWLQDQPHVSYLMTLVVGEFAIVEERWRGIPVQYYVPKDRVADAKPTFANTTAMLDFFSDSLGVPYPWQKYAQVCCYGYGGGGMENTSATTLGEPTLLTERARLDSDRDGLISHEMAHQWFGDLVTCADWAHIWLNEGFASYFEALWDEHHEGREAFQYNMYQKAQDAIRGGKEFPVVHRAYTSPDQQFDSRAYPKGAWVLHMLRCRLGDDLFWKVLNTYLTTHRHQPVVTDDLRRVAERVSGRSFERFFHDWTERPGNPQVEVSMEWREESRSAHVSIKQTQEAEAFHFPLVLEFRTAGADEADRPIRLTVMMTDKSREMDVPLPDRPTMFRVDPEQTVLMELTQNKSRDLWLEQLAADDNPVARLLALRHLKDKETDFLKSYLAAAYADEKYRPVKNELAQTLADLSGEEGAAVLVKGLEDSDARVREGAARALKKQASRPEVAAAVKRLLDHEDPSESVVAAALDSYASSAEKDRVEVAKRFIAVESYRDRIRSAAFSALGDIKDPAALVSLLDYYDSTDSVGTRRSLYTAMATLAALEGVEESDRQRVIDALVKGLKEDSNFAVLSAARALRTMGLSAASAVPALEAALAGDRSNMVKTSLEQALAAIRPKPAPDAAPAEQMAAAGSNGDSAAASPPGDNPSDAKEAAVSNAPAAPSSTAATTAAENSPPVPPPAADGQNTPANGARPGTGRPGTPGFGRRPGGEGGLLAQVESLSKTNEELMERLNLLEQRSAMLEELLRNWMRDNSQRGTASAPAGEPAGEAQAGS